jgi:hypothetical protein
MGLPARARRQLEGGLRLARAIRAAPLIVALESALEGTRPRGPGAG